MESHKLRVRLKDGTSYTVALPDRLTFGRNRDQSDVVIEDPYLSRRHCVLSRDGDRIFVEDVGRNGTFVNGERLEHGVLRELHENDVIGTNGHEISFEGESDESVTHTIWHDTEEDFTSVPSGEAVVDRRELAQAVRRLSLVTEVHRALSAQVNEQELLDLVLERACDHLGTETGEIFLRGPGGGLLRAASRCPAGQRALPDSRNLIEGVCEQGRTAVVPDTLAASRRRQSDSSDSIVASGTRSLVAAPLPGEGRPLGMLVVGSSEPARFDVEDIQLLQTLASVASLRILQGRLVEEAARKSEELVLARQVQRSLLRPDLPQLPGFEIDAENSPSQEVSGDYYRVIPRANGEWALLVVDVSGKGMPAALLTASVDALMEGPIEIGLGPAEICERVSRRLLRRTEPHRYATAFLALLDQSSGTLRYTSAAHVEGVIVRSSGDVEVLGSTGPPLGLIEGLEFGASEARLEPGDLVAIMTDGLTEAAAPDDEEYGIDRLQTLLSENRSLGLSELLEVIDNAVTEFTEGAAPSDDRTIILVRRCVP